MASKRLWWHSFILVILLVGCQPEKQDSGSISASGSIPQVENIEDYLVTNIGISAFDGQVFCAYEPLNAQQGAEGEIYLWALCLEYYLEQESLVPGSGISVPVALRIQEKNGHHEVIDHLVPRDGTYYGPDVRAIFPPSAWSQIYGYRGSELEKDAEMKARLYYDINTP